MVEFLQEETAAIVRRGEARRPDPDRKFVELGMDSLMGLELAYRIRDGVGVELPADTLFYQATIAQWADALLERLSGGTGAAAAPAEKSSLAANFFQEPEEKPATAWLHGAESSPNAELRLFCFHHLGGAASLFSGWSQDLPTEISLCPVQLPGREERGDEPAIRDFTTLIETLLDVLLEYPDRPFAFLGDTAGNLISYELAQLVRQR